MKKIIYLLTAILFYNAASAQVQVQIPITSNKPVFDKNYKVLSVTDTDWEQKSTLSIKGNPFTCELWITTDGTLHCKTDAVLSKTSILFIQPDITGPTGSSGSQGGLIIFNKETGSNEYTWGITEKYYYARHSITLTAYNEKGQKGVFRLINKKVPESIQY